MVPKTKAAHLLLKYGIISPYQNSPWSQHITYKASPSDYHTGEGSALHFIIRIILVLKSCRLLRKVNNQDKSSRQSEAYVVDTSYTINLLHQLYEDPKEISKTLADQITTVAQRAERTLHFTGGTLELTKCAWFELLWHWVAK